MLLKIDNFFDKFADFIGYLCGISVFLMMINVFIDVVLRYFFKTGSIAMQELEWHFFAFIILFGLVYALKDDAHVRVDVLYDRLSYRKKSMINIICAFLFLLPICILIASDSINYVLSSYENLETSADPGGLKYRWIVKSFIPISFFLLIFYTIGFVVKNVIIYLGLNENKKIQQ